MNRDKGQHTAWKRRRRRISSIDLGRGENDATANDRMLRRSGFCARDVLGLGLGWA